LAPAHPPHDGKQTPWRGRPVFVAQHATGVCCRGCLEKWHGIPRGRPLDRSEREYIATVLLRWLSRESRSDRGDESSSISPASSQAPSSRARKSREDR